MVVTAFVAVGGGGDAGGDAYNSLVMEVTIVTMVVMVMLVLTGA